MNYRKYWCTSEVRTVHMQCCVLLYLYALVGFFCFFLPLQHFLEAKASVVIKMCC